jgi:glycosyltransferase involved in cell wall biosynthesis
MNFLIIENFLHPKNKEGLIKVLEHLKIKYKFGDHSDIINYDIIYNPTFPINTQAYPTKRFIFGPHFSVFPDENLLEQINHKHKNAIYIQPSDWARDAWINMGANQYLPIHTLPFAVDTELFQPIPNIEKTEVFVYHKTRHPMELEWIRKFLHSKNITFTLFDYGKKYEQNDYIKCLQNAKYGIWLGRHESQGFALEEALSMNKPLLVWDVTSMNQEYGYHYENITATTIPYWDERCGESFTHPSQMEETFERFVNRLDEYKPREYILENLSVEACSKRFLELIEKLYK